MIQVKEFSGYEIDLAINEFIKENEGIKVIDIKYTATEDLYRNEYVSFALLIYKKAD